MCNSVAGCYRAYSNRLQQRDGNLSQDVNYGGSFRDWVAELPAPAREQF